MRVSWQGCFGVQGAVHAVAVAVAIVQPFAQGAVLGDFAGALVANRDGWVNHGFGQAHVVIDADGVIGCDAASPPGVDVAKLPFAGVGVAAEAAQVDVRAAIGFQDVPCVVFRRHRNDEAESHVVVFV